MVVLESAGLEINKSPSPESVFLGALGGKACLPYYSLHNCITSQYEFLCLFSCSLFWINTVLRTCQSVRITRHFHIFNPYRMHVSPKPCLLSLSTLSLAVPSDISTTLIFIWCLHSHKTQETSYLLIKDLPCLWKPRHELFTKPGPSCPVPSKPKHWDTEVCSKEPSRWENKSQIPVPARQGVWGIYGMKKAATGGMGSVGKSDWEKVWESLFCASVPKL